MSVFGKAAGWPLIACIALSLAVSGVSGQAIQGNNNPYSPSPIRQIIPSPDSAKANSQTVFIMHASAGTVSAGRAMESTPDTRLNIESIPATDVYKVAVGDILYINLKNAVRGSGYHAVRPDGTIDFPLGGGDLVVAGRTTRSIEDMLASRIVLYRAPQVEVKVREYRSHTIRISGLVANAGEKHLPREAVPLYVIKALALVSPQATKAVITSEPRLKTYVYDLRDEATDNILLYPGDSVEFVNDISKVETGTPERRN